jgi:adenine-specific DNA-methyltransferase
MSIEQIKKGNDLSQSLDIINENIAKLKELFPEVLTEGKIDFTVLQDILGEEIETGEEFYRFTWAGKTQARREAHKPSTGTLRPCKEDSVNWDTTENLYIEGDNLEVLKLLQKSYANKVKMIYIDPPYNTGKDFVYKDNYKDNLRNYQELTGQIDAEGNRLTTNSDCDGRYHSNWCNMIYPRLKLARNLLSEDGVIFISIDDNEMENLKKISNEIFGEENFRNYIITRRRVKSLNVQFADNGLRSLNIGFEYVLAYSKSDKFSFKALRMMKDNVPTKGSWNVFWSGADRPTMRYPLLGFTPNNGQWRWSSEKAEEAVRNYEEYFEKYSSNISLEEYWSNTGETLKFIRRIPNGEGKNGGVQYWIPPSESSLRTSNWTDIEVSQIQKEFDLPFENPKSTKLIKTILETCNDKDFIVLDFFSGSSTTAHSVMKLNTEDGGKRKYIMVQLPENCDKNSDAFKLGFNTLADIGRKRLKLAGEKLLLDNKNILEEWKKQFEKNKSQILLHDTNNTENSEAEILDFQRRIETLDIGYKVFKLDSSNIKAWDGNPAELEVSLFDSQDNIKTERTEEDVLYEILLKYGLDLTLPITEKTIAKKRVFSVGAGALFICLSNDITKEVAEGIGEWKQELNPEVCRVVFKDTGFNDVEKANSVQILKRFGINEIKSI